MKRCTTETPVFTAVVAALSVGATPQLKHTSRKTQQKHNLALTHTLATRTACICRIKGGHDLILTRYAASRRPGLDEFVVQVHKTCTLTGSCDV